MIAATLPDETKTIEAAVILRPGVQVASNELIRQLSQSLSPYAVPAKLQICSEFPRTTSGKIDRRQLQYLAEIRHATHEIH